MSTAERRAFDARLEARLEARRSRSRLPLPLWQPIAAAAVLAIAGWLVWSPPSGPPEVDAPTVTAHGPRAALSEWEREILAAADPVATPVAPGGAAILPDDYRAIAGLFLGGGSGDGDGEDAATP
jgi:hypothetical protein